MNISDFGGSNMYLLFLGFFLFSSRDASTMLNDASGFSALWCDFDALQAMHGGDPSIFADALCIERKKERKNSLIKRAM
jgi:hypothetical protein